MIALLQPCWRWLWSWSVWSGRLGTCRYQYIHIVVQTYCTAVLPLISKSMPLSNLHGAFSNNFNSSHKVINFRPASGSIFWFFLLQLLSWGWGNKFCCFLMSTMDAHSLLEYAVFYSWQFGKFWRIGSWVPYWAPDTTLYSMSVFEQFVICRDR